MSAAHLCVYISDLIMNHVLLFFYFVMYFFVVLLSEKRIRIGFVFTFSSAMDNKLVETKFRTINKTSR